MSYSDWFTENDHAASWCGGKRERDIRITGTIYQPDKLQLDRVVYNDQTAARLIAECEATAQALREYRAALAERYAALSVMPYTRILRLERQPNYGGGVKYFITIKQKFEDGTEQDELHEYFTGKERSAALHRFEELKKTYPGIVTEKDIEKKQWEK